MSLISQYDGTHVRVAGRLERYDRGSVVPDHADAEHVAVLKERGMVVEGEVEGGLVADPGRAPFRLNESQVSSDGSPAKSATKGEWVDHAVAHGADREQAESLTKEQLVEQYGAV